VVKKILSENNEQIKTGSTSENILKVENISVKIGDFSLNNVNFDLKKGEILTLMGHSGSGKTTILRIVAGLQKVNSGKVIFQKDSGDKVDITSWPAHKRKFPLMFQEALLFPHLDVAENVAFGLNHLKHEEKEARVNELLEIVELKGFNHRKPETLSGGEQQRVSLARTLAINPQLILLDEPFSSLDKTTKTKLIAKVRAILKNQNISAIFVTHLEVEAEQFGDRIIQISDFSKKS